MVPATVIVLTCLQSDGVANLKTAQDYCQEYANHLRSTANDLQQLRDETLVHESRQLKQRSAESSFHDAQQAVKRAKECAEKAKNQVDAQSTPEKLVQVYAILVHSEMIYHLLSC